MLCLSSECPTRYSVGLLCERLMRLARERPTDRRHQLLQSPNPPSPAGMRLPSARQRRGEHNDSRICLAGHAGRDERGGE